jgi:hypothetical protein
MLRGNRWAGKWSIVVDTIGLHLPLLVTAVSVEDSVTGTQLLDQVAANQRPPLSTAKPSIPPSGDLSPIASCLTALDW